MKPVLEENIDIVREIIELKYCDNYHLPDDDNNSTSDEICISLLDPPTIYATLLTES